VRKKVVVERDDIGVVIRPGKKRKKERKETNFDAVESVAVITMCERGSLPFNAIQNLPHIFCSFNAVLSYPHPSLKDHYPLSLRLSH